MQATLGLRVAGFMVETTFSGVASGSKQLRSRRKLQALMEKGGVALLEGDKAVSKFGVQTGQVHGGLLFSRSPTRFWHPAPGMLRDVDMAGCYQRIIAKLRVRWGRPVVFELGAASLTLAQAVNFVRQHADDDAWLIRASGDISAAPNALIPSADRAITSANYRNSPPGKRHQALRNAFHLEACRDPGSARGTRGARLYASRIESGVVTAATMAMVQALPAPLRQEYEALAAESIIFYPRKLAASTGQEFDALAEKYKGQGLPWESTIDLLGMELVHRVRIDADYVSLTYPIGDYAARVGELRRQAQEKEGKGGLEKAYKALANTMYGTLACPFLPTNNFLAANQITAHARAEAFAMSQALNAIQTITDGCTFRADQIPAVTFKECLQIKPDYPIRRAEDGEGIPFLDPSSIPQDDAAFTEWFRARVKWFFSAAAPEFDALIGTHPLEHKKTEVTRRVAFDVLACDGSGNYLKATQGDGGWVVEDVSARSYGRTSKEALKPWIVATYPRDRVEQLPPVTQDVELLSFGKACQAARKALESGPPEVCLPVGFDRRKVLAYRVVKPSAFVFNTPAQREAVLKQWAKFESRTGAGLELLTMRRSYGTRRRGSLSDLAEAIYKMIRSGEVNMTKALNLNRLGGLRQPAEARREEIRQRKREAEDELMTRIDVRNLSPEALITACLVTAQDITDEKLTLKAATAVPPATEAWGGPFPARSAGGHGPPPSLF
jgi:hypothetical protein